MNKGLLVIAIAGAGRSTILLATAAELGPGFTSRTLFRPICLVSNAAGKNWAAGIRPPYGGGLASFQLSDSSCRRLDLRNSGPVNFTWWNLPDTRNNIYYFVIEAVKIRTLYWTLEEYKGEKHFLRFGTTHAEKLQRQRAYSCHFVRPSTREMHFLCRQMIYMWLWKQLREGIKVTTPLDMKWRGIRMASTMERQAFYLGVYISQATKGSSQLNLGLGSWMIKLTAWRSKEGNES